MTPLERAEKIAAEYYDGGDPTVITTIHRHIIEATNDEVEKRRTAEAELENLRTVLRHVWGQLAEIAAGL